MTLDKTFTVAEARKSLPLVKQIVADILETGKQIKLAASVEEANLEESSIIRELESRLNGFLSELEEIGCYYKDWNFTTGLVDFPAVIDGMNVYLCWKSDEEDILYYHPAEQGFWGRLKIPDSAK